MDILSGFGSTPFAKSMFKLTLIVASISGPLCFAYAVWKYLIKKASVGRFIGILLTIVPFVLTMVCTLCGLPGAGLDFFGLAILAPGILFAGHVLPFFCHLFFY